MITTPPRTERPGPLTADQLVLYRRAGHLTVPGVFTDAETDAAIADAMAWGEAFLRELSPDQKKWYLERDMKQSAEVLRKLDNPVLNRAVFRTLAAHPKLVAMVEQIVGPGVSVYFSQVFMKPPGGGGPKPVHQDNYYFGPNKPEGVVTAWVALDEATVENGCLWFGEGTNLGPVYPHVAPAGEPFNLQVPSEEAAKHPMSPAPVPRGGVSFHHGNTFHQSADNRGTKWRRAAAMHYVNHRTVFATPALPYDDKAVVEITKAGR